MTAVGITVTVLGSGTAVPWRGRSAPGLAVAVDTEQHSCLALVDPGAGSSQRLVSCGHDFARLTHVLFSHFHVDHTGDLAPILFALENPRYRRVGTPAPIELIGPVGLEGLRRGLERVHGPSIELGRRQVTRELVPTEDTGFFTIGPLEVTWFPVDHTENSVAYRFESRAGKVLTYSGDTDMCDGILDAARGADILILECAFPEGQKRRGHLIPSEAGRIAMAAGVDKLILTHFYPECVGEDLLTPCRHNFSGEVLLARDGLSVHL